MDVKKQLLIIGAGGHGRVVADIAKLRGYENVGFLDDRSDGGAVDGYPVLGDTNAFEAYKENCAFIVAIGDNCARRRLYEKLRLGGGETVSLCHPNAVVAEGVQIGKGTVIMAGAVVNTGASIGNGVILNTCCSVDHDCVVGDFCHVSVGAHLAGTVNLGENVLVGAGATVIQNVDICADCVIGAGAVVIKDVKESGTYLGVPALLKTRG
ncbi:MAG: acetyltransferase [Clostridia bacterium]|nr:acetyltransferase [Clostridia bacterium]